MKYNDYQQVDGKILHHIKKGRRGIIFVEDLGMADDGWFITVRHTNKKKPEYKHESCICESNMQTWLDSYLNEGYTFVESVSK
jgi:hypothetical protein